MSDRLLGGLPIEHGLDPLPIARNNIVAMIRR